MQMLFPIQKIYVAMCNTHSNELSLRFDADNVIFNVGSAYRTHIMIVYVCVCVCHDYVEKWPWHQEEIQQTSTEPKIANECETERHTERKSESKEKSGDCKTSQHWIIHQTDFLPRSVHRDCFISYSTRNKFSHSLQISYFYLMYASLLSTNTHMHNHIQIPELSAFLLDFSRFIFRFPKHSV